MRVSPSEFRRTQRQNPTSAEQILWSELRNRQLGGYKFVRQVSLGDYTVDFICRRRKLIVEVDGGQHADSLHDINRTRWLNENGYGVIRFWNNEVLRERDAVLETLLRVLEGNIAGSETGLNFSPALPPERLPS